MKYNRFVVFALAASMSFVISGCGTNSASANVTSAVEETETEAVIETTTATVIETVTIDNEIYKISSGIWYLHGKEDEVSIDMDGLRGYTGYTAEAIPEYEGYLNYLEKTEDGWPIFDVLDMSGKQFQTITFTSEEQFYVNDDPETYYVKWDY